MSKAEAAKVKLSFWETIRSAWKPYRRLYGYAGPYKWRFALGLAFGVAYGLLTSALPLTVLQVSNFIFHGAAPNPRTIIAHPEMLNIGPRIDSIVWICLLIPLVMTVRSLCSYGNGYYMNWVSNKVVQDVRNQLFAKIVGHSMDFFNRMQTGFLMSRVANDTRSLQQALSSVSSDIFIPSVLTGSAMNGDKVKVEITNRKPGGRAEGRVASVEKRARDTVVGQLRWDGQVFFVAPADAKLPEKILITNDVGEHKDKIVEVETIRFREAALILLIYVRVTLAVV